MSFDVEFKDRLAETLKILPVKRPNIPAPERRYDTITIPGRDGDFHIDKKTYEPIDIQIEFNFMAEPDEWQGSYRVAKKWLTGGGELKFSDDKDFFYAVKYVNVSDSERTSLRIGRFTATFHCMPFMYERKGKEKIGPGTIYNPGYISHPIYYITGDGNCTITVNGRSFTANVGQSMTIDSDLEISYRETDTLNSSVSGDYEDIWLQEGENTVTITTGFTLEIVPNWRHL